ncbi:MAG: PilN domain-containing protein [Patescibacteria group bacterium]
MINLIPPHARRQVVTEYWLRVVSVWLFLLSAGLLIVSVLNVPLYVLVDQQKAAYAESSQVAATTKAQLEANNAIITNANNIARLLARGSDPTPFSTYLNQLEALAPAGITLSRIYLDRQDPEMAGEIRLQGVSATRQDLAQYRSSIEDSEQFVSAELPISNLAKNQDILFSITIVPDISNMPTS